jgi:phosphatidate cytidylyltransferase
MAALVFAPPLLVFVWYGRWPLAVVCALLAALLLWEYLELMLGPGERYLKAVGFGLGAAVALGTLGVLTPELTAAGAPLVILAALTAVLLRPDPIPTSITRAGVVAIGAVYAGGLIPYLARLRELPAGMALALMALFCTWGADTGAYFAGRLFGRHKLYPKISPGKTVEGFIGGLASAIGVAFLVRSLPSILPVAWHPALGLAEPGYGDGLVAWQLVAIGAIAAILGAVGDLSESMLKRSVGAKDSRNLIPGHGGVLDRFDAVMFVAPGVYVFALLAL